MPEDVEAKMLPGKLRVELLSLSAENSEVVARQLVMIDRLLASGADSDLTLAHQFGKAASERAGRVGIVRFYAGRAALSIRDFAEAKKHFSAALRINGAALMKVFLAECENGLGKSRKSLELLGEIKPGELSSRDWAYAHLISAEARESMGQHEAAWVTLSKKHEDLLTKLPVEDSAFVLRWQALKNRVAINLGKHSD